MFSQRFLLSGYVLFLMHGVVIHIVFDKPGVSIATAMDNLTPGCLEIDCKVSLHPQKTDQER